MATADIPAALTRLRAARAALYVASSRRTSALKKNARLPTVAELNEGVRTARAEVDAAKAAVKELLSLPEV